MPDYDRPHVGQKITLYRDIKMDLWALSPIQEEMFNFNPSTGSVWMPAQPVYSGERFTVKAIDDSSNIFLQAEPDETYPNYGYVYAAPLPVVLAAAKKEQGTEGGSEDQTGE